MAKRAPVDEKPYRPVDEALVRSVVMGSTAAQVRTEPEGEGQSHAEEVRGITGPHTALNGQLVQMPARPDPRPEASSGERLTREKRVLLSQAEERQIERLVDRMGEGLHTSLKLSHVLRAAVAVMLHAEAELVRRAEGSEPLTRPPNGDAVALARYEHELAKVIAQALRDAPPLR